VTTKKDGKALQRLIRSIESALAAGDSSIRVEVGKRFLDKKIEKLREHDVVLTVTHKHHETVIALECRDRSRPVGVDAIEAFQTKCRDTGIHSGIIVSGKGFCKTALKKAAHYNIRCLSLDEAENFNWCATPGINTYNRRLDHIHLFVVFSKGIDVKRETLRIEDGTPLNMDIVNRWGVNALNSYHPIPMPGPGQHRMTVRDGYPKLYSVHEGKRVRATEVVLTLDYTVSVEFSPFSFRTYMDVGKSKQVTQAAVGKVMLSKDESADMVLAANEKGEISVTLIPSPPSAAI
jgi:hypothetical protein